MDAPTTTSAGNGTSGDSDGGGWFTARTSPPSPGGDQEPEGNRLAALRPVGRSQKTPNGSHQNRESAARERIQTSADLPLAAPPRPQPVPDAAEHGSEHSVLDARGPAQRGDHAATASPDAVLIQRTMAEVGPVADKVTSYFYALLFVQHPELRSMFPPAMDAQRDRLLKALLTAAEHIDNTPVLVDYLQNLGRGHRKYGTQADHYPAVGECLIGALSRYAKASWSDETEAAWVRAYTTISQVMIDAAAADELRAPPWWLAEVVSHDPRTADIAVLTVRPNQPYPFLAGQYTSLETPWWPRIWRHYSFASAPRSDGLLSFHVKAISAGWVSNALVHRARPGDVLRLGPPAGAMTVDHATDSGLLCLGGGTGIAPIRAIVEDVAEHGRHRPVEVFYGARTGQDLYDLDTLLRLQQSNSWLEVRPVVDRHGLLQLPDAIRDHGPWNGYDAYLSGPPGMIRSGVDALKGAGIPSDRIRHDSVEELVAAGD
ncbi:globin domain-containing protein [Streptomyces europaeiscabiei]|uniref:globin domain-containing protein n=1 Tax=Streptomyces europaeiscabiei TaxID=146819 RepID=UPI0029B3D018|nr:globin domain-containing protein [Streptomyces europaeiscabiei]MDX3712546.1 globin domain-containing protein [Streptomyces europaeiscabiei]MDX3862447.1 globin domain-containing protein [Streptomyces europaeiscabiei]MDX3870599.1 globin domain-containing protein [Streptomyces europaeiscabiei]